MKKFAQNCIKHTIEQFYFIKHFQAFYFKLFVSSCRFAQILNKVPQFFVFHPERFRVPMQIAPSIRLNKTILDFLARGTGVRGIRGRGSRRKFVRQADGKRRKILLRIRIAQRIRSDANFRRWRMGFVAPTGRLCPMRIVGATAGGISCAVLMNFNALLPGRYMNTDLRSMIRNVIVAPISLRRRRRGGHGPAAAGRSPLRVDESLRTICPRGRLFRQKIGTDPNPFAGGAGVRFFAWAQLLESSTNKPSDGEQSVMLNKAVNSQKHQHKTENAQNRIDCGC